MDYNYNTIHLDNLGFIMDKKIALNPSQRTENMIPIGVERMDKVQIQQRNFYVQDIFPNNQSALKVIYLAIQKASQKWTMSLHDWRSAMNRFIIEFEGRIS